MKNNYMRILKMYCLWAVTAERQQMYIQKKLLIIANPRLGIFF